MDKITDKTASRGFWTRFMNKYQDGPRSLMKGKYIICFLFTFIPIIHFFVFYVGGNYFSFFLAFTKVIGYDGNYNEIYTFSLENFKEFFNVIGQADSGLLLAFKNTMILFVVHILQLCVNFVIAYTMAKKLKAASFFRVMLFLPSIISTVVLAIVVKNMLNTTGPISSLLELLTGKGFDVNPLKSEVPGVAYRTLIIYCVWAGFYQYLLIFEGAIRRVPEEVLESAKLDGINTRQELFCMIIPIMWDTISTIIIITFTALFTIDGPILLFTNGENGTMTLNFWFYYQVGITGNGADTLNFAATVGLIFAMVSLPIVFAVRKITSKISDGLEY